MTTDHSHCKRAIAQLTTCVLMLACSRDPQVTIGVARRTDAAGSAADSGRASPAIQGARPGSPSTPATASGARRPEDRQAPTPTLIDQTGANNPAGLALAEVERLAAGGPVGKMRWLYPYDGTVFPRGTKTTLIMWLEDGVPDAVYLRIRSKAFEYKGVLKPGIGEAVFVPPGIQPLGTAGGINTFAGAPQRQAAIPQEVWEMAGRQSLGRSDPFTLELTERVDGVIHGPISAQITIAEAGFKGSIYYNACVGAVSTDVASMDPRAGALVGLGINAKVLRIPPGGQAERILQPDRCSGCHSVSADGSRMVLQQAGTIDSDLIDILTTLSRPPAQGLAYAIGQDGLPIVSQPTPVGPLGAFGTLSPNGKRYLATALPDLTTSGINPIQSPTLGYGMTTVGASAAALYDAESGQPISDTQIPPSAMMPSFSPDGSHLVFNDLGVADGRALAVMEYDARHDRASGYRVLVQEDPNAALRPGWPFFLPDNRAVVFTRTTAASFSGTSGFSGSANGNLQQSSTASLGAADKLSDLYIADLATGRVTLLAKAMGFDTPEAAESGETYLPFGAEDLHRNYYPTVSPVAAGGYFWVFFDSLRNFGSLGMQRLIWGFAIDIAPDGHYTHDPSHPPFYLAGQEYTGSNNHRAFAALDRCKPLGTPCANGIECCEGFCAETCVPPTRCAKLDERCSTAADCCDSSQYCINNFCAAVELL